MCVRMWISILYLQPHKIQHQFPDSHPIASSSDGFFPPCIETPPFASTALPVTAVPRILFGFHVKVVDVIHQVLEGVEEQMTLEEATTHHFIAICLT